jgi:hypothetical protein
VGLGVVIWKEPVGRLEDYDGRNRNARGVHNQADGANDQQH